MTPSGRYGTRQTVTVTGREYPTPFCITLRPKMVNRNPKNNAIERHLFIYLFIWLRPAIGPLFQRRNATNDVLTCLGKAFDAAPSK